MHLVSLNAAGKSLAPAKKLDPKRRRLSQVIGRHVDPRRPHMVAVQRASDPSQPLEEAWVERGTDKFGRVKPWPRRYLPSDAVVVVVYLPRGGSASSGGGSRSKSPLSIALGIAAVALIAFAGPIGGFIAGAVGVTSSFGIAAITAGVAIGGSVLMSLASRAKADKQPTETTQIYGISGGGNTPKPGDRIPRGYGRSWMKPDLSQPDSSQYDGDDLIAFKRHTIGVGRYRPYALRVGKQIVWREGEGFIAPFNDPRNQIEFLYGTPSTLVPNNIVAATGIGGALPRPEENPSVAGPFLINQRGALVTRLQVDFQFPQGIARTDFFKSGATRSNQPGAWAVYFEYAPIDETGRIVGDWQVLYNGNSGAEGARFSTHALRYTRFKDVPPGRYAVRGRNVQPDSTQNTAGNATVDAAQWDSAAGWVNDSAVRPGITEVCLRLYATKGTQAASFAELEVDAAAIIPVWNGNSWVEQETRKSVWAYLDVMRNQDYGGALLDSQLDLGTALAYANRLTEFDTFDATIRGPVSVLEAASTALLTMRAEPVHLGRYWSLVRDEPKAVRKHVITPRQMLKGSTQIVFDLDTAAGAGHVIGEFDQDGDYRNPNQTTAIFGEASITPTRLRWTGVRDYAHANHLTKWRAACGAFRRQGTPFGVELEGRIYKRGDSILVDPWFLEARRRAGVIANNTDVLLLDCDLVQNQNDVLVLRNREGQVWGPVTLLGQNNPREIRLNPVSRAQVEFNSGQSLDQALATGQQELTTVLVGSITSVSENYIIKSVSMDGPNQAQVDALVDDPRVWEILGAPIVIPPEGASGLRDPEVPRIVALSANATPVAAGFRCDYAIKPGRGAVRFEIGVSYDDGNRFDTRPDAPITGSIDLNPVDPTLIVLRARAFGAGGLPGPYFLTELGLPSATLNAALPPIDYDDFNTKLKELIQKISDIADSAVEQAKDLLKRVLAAAAVGDANTAAIVSESQARLTADSGIATDLSAAVVRIDGVAAAVVTERKASIDRDSAQASRTDLVIVQANDDRAFVSQVNQARIDGDGVQATRTDLVIAQAGADRAFITEVNEARVTDDNKLGLRINAVEVTAAQDRAFVGQVNEARIAGDQANASSINSVSARTNYGTANGQFGITATAGSGSVTTRFQALLSTSAGGQTFNAGYYLEVLTNGTSRFVVDANYFYITSNNSVVPAFSFDGQTLTIPYLRVTQGLILPNQVSDKYVKSISGRDLGAANPNNGWIEIPETAFVISPDAQDGWAVTWTVTTNIQVTANGSNATYRSVSLETAVALNGNIYNGGASNVVSIGAGGGLANQNTKGTGLIGSSAMEVFPPGDVRIAVYYRLRGDSTCTGRIDFAQIKAVVIKR